ncbi:MAG: peptidylprolyl isomerase [Nitrospirae bacterium]|nr:peptidylprolyl isomerase [Nitrospirota bacterium]MBF0535914.1 peptidylprolyl isomerase [Nitrospirota bacterium]MBF0617754.1 peptidylprolyl isomerase [Nitrospirota bacterium]
MVLICALAVAINSEAVMLDRVVAVIDKDVITWSELYRMMEFEMSDKLKGMKQSEKLAFLKTTERQALDKLIEMKLILSEAQRRGIALSQKELDAAIDDIRVKYKVTPEEFAELLKKEGFTFDEYKKRFADQIIIQKLTSAEIYGKVMVSDEEVKARMNNISAAPDSGSNPGKYRIRLILILKKNDAQEDKKIEDKMAEIYTELTKGADFAKLAAKYSEGPNVSNGGDIGFVNKEDMEKDVADIVVGMKAGEFSKVVNSKDSFKIVQLMDKQSSDAPDKHSESVKNEIQDEKAKEHYKDFIKSLKDKRVIKILL